MVNNSNPCIFRQSRDNSSCAASQHNTNYCCPRVCPCCCTNVAKDRTYALIKNICMQIFKDYEKEQCKEKYTVFGGGNSINLRIHRSGSKPADTNERSSLTVIKDKYGIRNRSDDPDADRRKKRLSGNYQAPGSRHESIPNENLLSKARAPKGLKNKLNAVEDNIDKKDTPEKPKQNRKTLETNKPIVAQAQQPTDPNQKQKLASKKASMDNNDNIDKTKPQQNAKQNSKLSSSKQKNNKTDDDDNEIQKKVKADTKPKQNKLSIDKQMDSKAINQDNDLQKNAKAEPKNRKGMDTRPSNDDAKTDANKNRKGTDVRRSNDDNVVQKSAKADANKNRKGTDSKPSTDDAKTDANKNRKGTDSKPSKDDAKTDAKKNRKSTDARRSKNDNVVQKSAKADTSNEPNAIASSKSKRKSKNKNQNNLDYNVDENNDKLKSDQKRRSKKRQSNAKEKSGQPLKPDSNRQGHANTGGKRSVRDALGAIPVINDLRGKVRRGEEILSSSRQKRSREHDSRGFTGSVFGRSTGMSARQKHSKGAAKQKHLKNIDTKKSKKSRLKSARLRRYGTNRMDETKPSDILRANMEERDQFRNRKVCNNDCTCYTPCIVPTRCVCNR